MHCLYQRGKAEDQDWKECSRSVIFSKRPSLATSLTIQIFPSTYINAGLFILSSTPPNNDHHLTHMCALSHSAVSSSLRPPGLQPATLLCPWNYPGKNTGVGCHSLLQGISPTQGWNLCLLHWQADCPPLCHLGSPSNIYTLFIYPFITVCLPY